MRIISNSYRGKKAGRRSSVIITVPSKLSSAEFYNSLLPKVYYLLKNNPEMIVFDFSLVKNINALVIPDLLCIGYGIKKKLGQPAILYIPETMEMEPVKDYLYQIRFTELARKRNQEIFKFYSSPTAGMLGKKIDPLCRTFFFDTKISRDEISQIISFYILEFADKYLSRFIYKDVEYTDEKKDIIYKNAIVEFIREAVYNCSEHSESFSVATLHANYNDKRVFISVSDYGRGFLKSSSNNCMNEYEAIMYGVYKRCNEHIYGLYNMVETVLRYNGLIRIHSNDTRVVFSPRWKEEFLQRSLNDSYLFKKYNVRNTVFFKGAHIEIELPFAGE